MISQMYTTDTIFSNEDIIGRLIACMTLSEMLSTILKNAYIHSLLNIPEVPVIH